MKPTRLMSPPGTYFVTFSTFQRRRFFVVESYARLFLKTLYGYRRQGRFRLHAFVLMPDHVHLLFTPAADVTLGCSPHFWIRPCSIKYLRRSSNCVRCRWAIFGSSRKRNFVCLPNREWSRMRYKNSKLSWCTPRTYSASLLMGNFSMGR